MKRYILLLFLVITPFVALSGSAQAADVLDRGVCDKFIKDPPLPDHEIPAVCKDKDLKGANPLTGKDGVLTSIINLLTLIVAVVSTVIIILAGLKFVTSGTNPQDLTKAREQIIYALVALLIAALAQVIVRFIIDKV